MALAFRNLMVSPDSPVSDWPTEAIQIALERGDLGDWQRIVTELKREPWGRTARQVEEVLSHSRPSPGTALKAKASIAAGNPLHQARVRLTWALLGRSVAGCNRQISRSRATPAALPDQQIHVITAPR